MNAPGATPCQLTISGIRRVERNGFGTPDHVVSILDPGWQRLEPLAGLAPDALTEMRFHDVVEPAPGMTPPARADVARLVALGGRLRDGCCRHLHVHCHMGVSRSTAAAAIVRLAGGRTRMEEALAEIDALRPRNWPNSLMVRHADDLLGLGGAFVRALARHHRRVAERDPELARLIIVQGRGHEVPASCVRAGAR